MPSLKDGVVPPFLGALQACTSVLLTLVYGIMARQAGIIHEHTINDMSGICVKVFLPALIMVKLGSELYLGIAINYLPVFVWSLAYTAISVAVGLGLSRLLRLPQWVTPAVATNNTSSLPLLLLETLKSTGAMALITPPEQTQQNAVDRAQSYFLICAVTTKTISYAIAPRLLRDTGNKSRGCSRQSEDEVDPEVQTTVAPHQQQDNSGSNHNNSNDNTTMSTAAEEEVEEEAANEQTSLLPARVQTARHNAGNAIHHATSHLFSYFPSSVQRGIDAIDSPFLDAALLCTATGVLVGLVPKLHHAFFASFEDGGIFGAWLTSSIMNLGELFTSLQVFLVGCKLGVSFEKMRRSKASGDVPVRALLVVFCIRLILWPVVSISSLYLFVRYTNVLPHDPILWFSMMVMPTGPPALIISGLSELDDVSEVEKMAIAKVLAIMYILSPSVSFTITGALKATEAIVNSRGQA